MDIFIKIAKHLLTGTMLHEQFSICFDFLNLKGYYKSQEYHYYEETIRYKNFCHFIMDNYRKIIKIDGLTAPTVIPPTWYKYEKEDMDSNTRRTAIHDLFKQWVEWEQATKKLLEECYKELQVNNDINASLYIASMIEEVGEELVDAKNQLVELESINYDMTVIIPEQNNLYHTYTKKIKHLMR